MAKKPQDINKRSNIVTNSIKTLKMVHIKTILKKKDLMEIVHIRGVDASLVAQTVKNLPAIQKTPVRYLGWEDLLEKG